MIILISIIPSLNAWDLVQKPYTYFLVAIPPAHWKFLFKLGQLLPIGRDLPKSHQKFMAQWHL